MKKSFNVILILALFLIAVVAISGCAQYGQQAGQQQEQAQPSAPPEAPPVPPATPEQQVQPPAPPKADHVVEITSAGFGPKTLTIKAGETVAFFNTDVNKHWPASAVHPTHEVYPGSGITKCGTAEASKIFDACIALPKYEAFVFKFDQKGTWNYHDHWDPRIKGTIVVE